jgi:hypothetical protein
MPIHEVAASHGQGAPAFTSLRWPDQTHTSRFSNLRDYPQMFRRPSPSPTEGLRQLKVISEPMEQKLVAPAMRPST